MIITIYIHEGKSPGELLSLPVHME